jgi:hypothetical protein
VANYCHSNGINGPCIQLYYPTTGPTGWSSADQFINYMNFLAPYLTPGTFEIACNEILNAATRQENIRGSLGKDPLLPALGGPGATGYDGLIALIKLERAYLPAGVLLGLNEFNVCDNYSNSFFNQAECIRVYKILHDNGAPLDWLGCEGYWTNYNGVYADQLSSCQAAVNTVGAAILPYLTGACGTAFIAYTEWSPMLYWGSKQNATQQANWQAWLNMFANNQYIFGVTGPWNGFRRSDSFSPTSGVAGVDWLYDDTNNGGTDPDGVATFNGHVTPTLAWLQGWVPGNVHP